MRSIYQRPTCVLILALLKEIVSIPKKKIIGRYLLTDWFNLFSSKVYQTLKASEFTTKQSRMKTTST